MPTLLDHPVFQALAWTLLHFLWQGALLGLLARGLLRLLRKRPPQARYLVACLAMAAMSLAPTVTFAVLRPAAGQVELVVESEPPASPSLRRAEATERLRPALRERVRPLLPWALALWMAGVALLSLRLFGGWLWLLRLRGRLSEPAGACWQMGLNALARRMHVKEGVRLLRSWAVDAPMVVGWIKPTILVPAAAFLGLSPAALEAVLAHELAHVRRHDYLVNLLQSAVEVLLFYHPAVWWVSAQVRQERELCCDDAAVALCGDAVLYARALTELEQLRRPLEPAPQLALAAHGGNLMHRITRLIAPTLPPSPTRRAGLLAALAVTALGAGTAMRLSEEQPKPPAPPSAPASKEERIVIVRSDRGNRRQVRIHGDVKVQPDPQHDLLLGDNGSLEISQRDGEQHRRFKAWKEGGAEKRSYTVNGTEKPVDQAWLAKELSELKESRAKAKDGEARAHRIEVRVKQLDQDAKDSGRKVEKEIRIERPGKDGEERIIRIERDGSGAEGKPRVFMFRGGKEVDAEELARHAREMALRGKELALHGRALALKHEDMAEHMAELHDLQIPEFDFDFDFDSDGGHPADGKRVIVKRLGPEGLPGLKERGQDPRREVERLRAEIDRLNRRLERLQERLDEGRTPPPAPKPPKSPKAAPAPPAPPAPSAPRALPPPPPPPTPAPKL